MFAMVLVDWGGGIRVAIPTLLPCLAVVARLWPHGEMSNTVVKI